MIQGKKAELSRARVNIAKGYSASPVMPLVRAAPCYSLFNDPQASRSARNVPALNLRSVRVSDKSTIDAVLQGRRSQHQQRIARDVLHARARTVLSRLTEHEASAQSAILHVQINAVIFSIFETTNGESGACFSASTCAAQPCIKLR